MYQSEWLDIILIAGFLQGIFFCIVLWKKKHSNRQALSYLVAAVALLSLLMLGRATFQPSFVHQFAEVIMLPDVILFLGGPLSYFFTLSLLRKPLPPKPRIYLHYLPALIHVVFVNTTVGLNLNGVWNFMDRQDILLSMFIVELAAIISFLVYFLMSFSTYRQYREAYYEKYSSPFLGRFLQPFFVLTFSIIGFWAIGFVYNYSLAHPNFITYVISWFLLAFTIYYLAYQVWSHPELLELPQLRNIEKTPRLEIPKQLKLRLQQFMEREKPYLDPDLKLGILAETLEMPKHELSKVINHGFEQNFFDFINSYRIQEFIILQKDERYAHLNFLELAYESGFNSKSAFNRAFRKETGQSPSTFFEKVSQTG